jgi:hypothetical protein
MDTLEYLRYLFTNLPDTIPSYMSLYNFQNFTPDPEKVELYGSKEGALNNALEVTFAPRGRQEGPNPFMLKEKGPGLLAVVDVLQQFSDDFPTLAIIQKWVEDFTKSAKYQFDSIGLSVCDIPFVVVKLGLRP